MKGTYRKAGMLLALLLVSVSCATLQPQVTAPGEAGKKTIAIEARNFEFTPNNIKAVQGDTITFNISNVADGTHNFTIKDPKGKKLQEVDLPPKKTIPVTVLFPETGKYEFYCDKTFHSTLGMKGQVEVVAGPSPH